MKENVEILDGEYVVLPKYASPGAFIAEIHHVHRIGKAKLFTPVAHISAFKHLGADMTYPHWSVRMFVRSDVRYEAKAKTTTVVANPERQAGPNKAMLKHLLTLRDSNLPYIHPDLPQALGRGLIDASICSEPSVVHIHNSNEQNFVELGKVFHDDDE